MHQHYLNIYFTEDLGVLPVSALALRGVLITSIDGIRNIEPYQHMKTAFLFLHVAKPLDEHIHKMKQLRYPLKITQMVGSFLAALGRSRRCSAVAVALQHLHSGYAGFRRLSFHPDSICRPYHHRKLFLQHDSIRNLPKAADTILEFCIDSNISINSSNLTGKIQATDTIFTRRGRCSRTSTMKGDTLGSFLGNRQLWVAVGHDIEPRNKSPAKRSAVTIVLQHLHSGHASAR